MHFQFLPGVSLKKENNGKFTIASQIKSIKCNSLSPGLLKILYLMQNEREVGYCHSFIKDEEELLRFHFIIEKLNGSGFLSYSVIQNEKLFLQLIPMQPPLKLIEANNFENFKLSKFCCIHSISDEMVLETPLSSARLLIKNGLMGAFIHALSKSCSIESLSMQFPSLTRQTIFECLQLLASAKAICFADEENDPALAQWEFHDLFFHSRSRKGRHNNLMGGAYPFKEKISPLPCLKSYASSVPISLYRPDLEELKNNDRPFTEILEERKSIRKQGKSPITIKQVGEFLFRTARIKKFVSETPQQLALRTYPSGGAIHELELYLLIHSCDQVDPGLYHYDPFNHQLVKLSENNEKTEELLNNAKLAAKLESKPQILIILSSRFQRRSWKYTSISYSTTLKNVGVLIQNMYLVATAMNLAPCALGSGNSDLFAELIQSNYFEETSVGEFILGRKNAC
jgi:SagB-type dehydrogenase family enzyme